MRCPFAAGPAAWLRWRRPDHSYVLLVNPNVPARTVQEFIALAKAAPDTVHYASSGNGSAQHLMGGLFVSMTGARLVHVPCKGSSGAASDLVTGVVESSFAGVSTHWRRCRKIACGRWS